MCNIFNNRELAVGIWALLLIAWKLRKPEIRKSFRTAIGALLYWKILSIFIVFCGFVLFCVYVLYLLTIWDISQAKNTIVWSVFVGSAALFGIINIKNGSNYFSSSIKQQFRITVFIEFLVAFHTFGLIIELLLVLFSTILACVGIYAEYHQEHHSTKIIADSMLSIFGIALFSYSIYLTISNSGKFVQFSTFQNFIVPILLTIFTLPFLYFLSRLVAYEEAFFKVKIYTNLRLRRLYAILSSFVAFKGNSKAIEDWLKHSCIPEFKSNESIKESIKNYKKRRH